MLLRREDVGADRPSIADVPGTTSKPPSRIRCPHCGWQPSASDRWRCVSHGPPESFDQGCRTVWNTFETRGRCPGCDHQWRWTLCLACRQWSRHEDWYENPA